MANAADDLLIHDTQQSESEALAWQVDAACIATNLGP